VHVGGVVYVYVRLYSINTLQYRSYFAIQYHLKRKHNIFCEVQIGILYVESFKSPLGYASTQPLTGRLLTAKIPVRSQTSTCEFCSG
jgi:hypothetical protein